jgi:hypothetical protein
MNCIHKSNKVIQSTLTWMIQHSTHPENSVGMAWRPDSTCHKTVQLWKVALCHGFSPVQEAFNTCHLIAQPFKVVPVEREWCCLSRQMHTSSSVTGRHNYICHSGGLTWILVYITVWFTHFSGGFILKCNHSEQLLRYTGREGTVGNDWVKERHTQKQKLDIISHATCMSQASCSKVLFSFI